MIAETAGSFDIGPNLLLLLTPLAAAAGSYFSNRKVRKEMGNNGGSTMRDAIDRIELKLEDFDTRMGTLEKRSTTTAEGVATAVEQTAPHSSSD
jgi:hypothetical protein